MEYASGNIFIREMRFESKGDVVGGHKHNFDHTTYVARGGLRIERLAEDDSVEHAVEKWAGEGFNWVLIKAGVKHRITALSEGAIGHCIYSHRNPQGEIVQEYDGWRKALI